MQLFVATTASAESTVWNGAAKEPSPPAAASSSTQRTSEKCAVSAIGAQTSAEKDWFVGAIPMGIQSPVHTAGAEGDAGVAERRHVEPIS